MKQKVIEKTKLSLFVIIAIVLTIFALNFGIEKATSSASATEMQSMVETESENAQATEFNTVNCKVQVQNSDGKLYPVRYMNVLISGDNFEIL